MRPAAWALRASQRTNQPIWRCEAIEALPSDIRRKLWAVMRTGCGDYARDDWDQAMATADNLSDQIILGDLAEEIDLHDRLMKGLYEIGAAELPGPPP